MALTKDMPAGTVLLSLNSHPLFCTEIAVVSRSRFMTANSRLLFFKSPEFARRQLAATNAVDYPPLLASLSLIDCSCPSHGSGHQEDGQAACHRHKHPVSHKFVSLAEGFSASIFLNPESRRGLRWPKRISLVFGSRSDGYFGCSRQDRAQPGRTNRIHLDDKARETAASDFTRPEWFRGSLERVSRMQAQALRPACNRAA